jgi:hypothetical protein
MDSDTPAMIHLSLEQRLAVHQAQTPIHALDPDTNREYVILERAAFEKMKRAADFDPVDPSLFEFDQLDTVVASPHAL